MPCAQKCSVLWVFLSLNLLYLSLCPEKGTLCHSLQNHHLLPPLIWPLSRAKIQVQGRIAQIRWYLMKRNIMGEKKGTEYNRLLFLKEHYLAGDRFWRRKCKNRCLHIETNCFLHPFQSPVGSDRLLVIVISRPNSPAQVMALPPSLVILVDQTRLASASPDMKWKEAISLSWMELVCRMNKS